MKPSSLRRNNALVFVFPASYREFLLRFGAGSFGSFEIYGVIDERHGGVPDVVWATEASRSGPYALPVTMVVFGADGMGGDYVLDTAKGDEPPVEVWEVGATRDGDPLERLSDGFADFLLAQIQAQAQR